jgi:hypothetical protein
MTRLSIKYPLHVSLVSFTLYCLLQLLIRVMMKLPQFDEHFKKDTLAVKGVSVKLGELQGVYIIGGTID